MTGVIESYPYTVKDTTSTYMVCIIKLDLWSQSQVLDVDDIPSIHAKLRLQNGLSVIWPSLFASYAT
jgi:hypothetical protein